MLHKIYSMEMILSVQFSCSVVSNSLQPHGLQHTRLPCPSLTPRACSNSCPSNRWCHPTISSSVVPFSSRPQSFPASGSFPMSQFFASGGQSIGASVSASVLSMNIQGWFPSGLRSPCSPRDSQESSTTPQFKSISSKALSAKMGSIKDRNGMDLTEAEDIRRGGKNTQKNCTKKIFTTQIITMLWSLT